MRDVTLVIFTAKDQTESFVTTAFNEAKFVQETFGQPDSERKLEDYERLTMDNVVHFEFASDSQAD